MKIYYRFCDKGKIIYQGQEIPKIACFGNFIYYFNVEDIRLILDNCSDETYSYFKHFNLHSIQRTNLGNCGSFKWLLNNIDYCSNPNDIIYLVEDDYLHTEKAPKLIQEGLEMVDYVCGDHLDKYDNLGNPHVTNKWGEITSVFLTKSSHWKHTNSTMLTFASKAKTLLSNITDMIETVGNKEIPDDYKMWRKLKTKWNLPYRTLANPLPSHNLHFCKSGHGAPFFPVKEELSKVKVFLN